MVTDEMVEAAYAAARNAMPHEALSEIGVGELEKVVRAALTAALAVAPKPTHRHKKRGTEYVLLGYGNMQAAYWLDGLDDEGRLIDMRVVAIYRSVDNGALWVRPREEFEDGRFEVLEDQS